MLPRTKMRGHSTLCDSAAGVFVSVTMLAVGVDAVAKLHAQRAVSERGRVGAAECTRPLGVGVDVFGELEFFVRDTNSHHTIHRHAVTQGLDAARQSQTPGERNWGLRYSSCNFPANWCAIACRIGAEPASVKRTMSCRIASPGMPISTGRTSCAADFRNHTFACASFRAKPRP